MSKIEEIEQAVEQLPLKDFAKLAVWVDQRRQQLEIIQPATDKSQAVGPRPQRLPQQLRPARRGSLRRCRSPVNLARGYSFHERRCLEAASRFGALDGCR